MYVCLVVEFLNVAKWIIIVVNSADINVLVDGVD